MMLRTTKTGSWTPLRSLTRDCLNTHERMVARLLAEE